MPKPDTLKVLSAWLLSYIILTVLCNSCNSHDANDQKNLQKIFNKESFDQDIINALPLYDSLKTIILRNKTSIIDYRDKISHFNKDLKIDTSHISDTEPYFFIFLSGKGTSDQSISLNTLPKIILDSILPICNAIGPKYLMGFDIEKHSEFLRIDLKDVYYENTDIETHHTLQWNWDYRNQQIPFLKDTLLKSKWIYYINSEKRVAR